MFKRDLYLFIRSLLPVFVAGMLLFLGCAGAVFALFDSERGTFKKITIAVANYDREGIFSESVINAALNSRMISTLAEAKMCGTKEEALEAIEEGAAGAVIIPEGFFESIYAGENEPGTLIVNDELAGQSDLVRIYASLATDILTEVQRWIYAGDKYLSINGADNGERSQYNLKLNMDMLISTRTAMDAFVSNEKIPYTSGGLPIISHYLILYFIFFTGVAGISFGRLHHDDMKRSVVMRLHNCGITEKKFMMWKLLFPTAFFAVLFFIAAAAAAGYADLSFGPAGFFAALAGVAFTAVFTALLSIGAGRMSGGIIFVIYLFSLFFCGGIVPYSSLAPAVITIGKLTPAGAAYSLIGPMFGGAFEPSCIVVCIVYIALGILLAHHRYTDTVSGRAAV